jgi:endo-1,4-beta-xylanase
LSPICDGWASAEHCGYVYEYWKDNGTGCPTVTPEGFEVSWSNINNLLGRKGLSPGSRSNIVHYEADYNPNGNSYLSIYGWTTNPLIEYYIVDSWGSWRPPGSQPVGQAESDGETYDIYRTTRVNQPSIEGTNTFDQYWSVRTEKKEAGTITVGNHFDAWEANGLNLGSLYEVSMNVEGYQSQGSVIVRFSMK